MESPHHLHLRLGIFLHEGHERSAKVLRLGPGTLRVVLVVVLLVAVVLASPSKI